MYNYDNFIIITITLPVTFHSKTKSEGFCVFQALVILHFLSAQRCRLFESLLIACHGKDRIQQQSER